MAKRFSRRITRKTRVRLSPKDAETIIRDEFTTDKGFKMRKEFIFKPENPKDSGIKVYFNHERGNE